MRSGAAILLLVEGARTDRDLMAHLLAVYDMDRKYEIVSYNTNIYTLYNEMFRDGDPAAVDLLQVLKAREKDPEKKALFDRSYSDVLLIFDLDPQDPLFTTEKILQMANYFTESTEMGKLYLNYPMVEAFYHMKSIPDADYPTYTVTLDALRHKQYKERVWQESRNKKSFSEFAVSREECSIVIRQNIEKALVLIDAETADTPDAAARNTPDGIAVLQKQLELLTEEQLVSVLSTCGFYIPDYNLRLLDGD